MLGEFAKDMVYWDTKKTVLEYANKLLALSEEMERFSKYTEKQHDLSLKWLEQNIN